MSRLGRSARVQTGHGGRILNGRGSGAGGAPTARSVTVPIGPVSKTCWKDAQLDGAELLPPHGSDRYAGLPQVLRPLPRAGGQRSDDQRHVEPKPPQLGRRFHTLPILERYRRD